MRTKFHGIFSLCLLYVSIAIGLVSIFYESENLGLIYGAVIVISPLIIVYSYCTKCLCRGESCGHLFPGKLAKILPFKEQKRYTFMDIMCVVMPVAALLAFPQFWLWRHTFILIVFWVLIAMSILEIRYYVSSNCTNELCLICKNTKIN